MKKSSHPSGTKGLDEDGNVYISEWGFWRPTGQKGQIVSKSTHKPVPKSKDEILFAKAEKLKGKVKENKLIEQGEKLKEHVQLQKFLNLIEWGKKDKRR